MCAGNRSNFWSVEAHWAGRRVVSYLRVKPGSKSAFNHTVWFAQIPYIPERLALESYKYAIRNGLSTTSPLVAQI